MAVCYCLIRSDSGATYIGATMDMEHRLRQHNGELAGGAHYTSTALASGKNWEIACTVGPFPTWQAALQFEWKWKKISQCIKHHSSLQKRLEALNILLSMGKSTYTSTPFDQWPTPPEVHEN
jgi:structure-specific endonuclease subunit SLX1